MNRLEKSLSTVLLLALTGPFAAPPASCEEPKISGEVELGGQYVADDPQHPAKFLEYRDVPSGFVADRIIFQWQPKGLYLNLDAIDATQKDQRILLQFGQQDLWRGFVRWAESPRLFSDHARQLYAQRSDAVFKLDNTLQTAIQAAPASVDANMDGEWDAGTKGAVLKSAIAESAQEAPLGLTRKTGAVGVESTPTRSWTFGVSGERERRSGLAPQTLGMYFTLGPSEVAAPVDFSTDTAVAYGEYTSRYWLAGARLSFSNFDTGYKPLTWDDQLFLNDTAVNVNTADPARGRMLLGADNRARQWTAYAAGNLPGRTRISATASQNRVTQDDPFLAMTTNSLLSPSPLPDSSLDGEYRNDLLHFTVSSRPLHWLHVRAWWRKFEFDNRTPSLKFADYVMTDYQFPTCSNANSCGTVGARIARRNLPYAYDTKRTGGSANVTPLGWLDLGVLYEQEKTDREFSAVNDTKQNTWKFTADVDVASWLSLRGTYWNSRRRTDEYNGEFFEESFPIGEPFVAGVNEGERVFIWTDRDRKAYSGMVDVTPLEWLSFYGEATYAKNEYFDPNTGQRIGESYKTQEDRNFDGTAESYTILLAGRTGDKVKTYSVGTSVGISKRVDLYADYTWERMNNDMASRYRAPVSNIGSDNPLDDWTSGTLDKYRTFNLGIGAGLVPDKLRLDASWSQSKGQGDIHTNSVPGGNPSGDTTLSEFPRLKSDLYIGLFSLAWTVRPNVALALRYWYEKWNEDNWASDFMKPYMGDPDNDPGSVHAIYLGTDYSNYRNHVAGVFLRYTF